MDTKEKPPCWLCKAPSVWHLTAQRKDPDRALSFYVCEKCVPFSIADRLRAGGAQ